MMTRFLFVSVACFASVCFAAEDDPKGDSPSVTPEASAKEEESPRRWLAKTGKYFERQEDGRWIEVTKTGAVEYVFQEDGVTPEYTDLVDRSRNMRVRLQNQIAEWRIDVPEGPWNRLTRGGWHTGAVPEAVEQEDPGPEMAPRTEAEEAALAKAIEEVERFIEENPDAPLDMSHLKNLEPELAEVLICTDDTPRTATRRVPVVRSVIVPVTIDGEPTEQIERQESFIERPVQITGKVLKLNGLETLSSEVAFSLSSHQGDLYLNGLTELSEEVADSLSVGSHTLYLDGLRALSDKAASLLALHDGALSLRGLERISRKAFNTLSASGIDGMGGMGVGDAKCWLPRNIIIEDTVRRAPQVNWSTMPNVETFRNYVRLLSEKSETAIEIDEKAFERQGISPDTKLSTRLLGSMLWLLQKQLGPDHASIDNMFAFGVNPTVSIERAVIALTMLLHSDPTVAKAGGTLHCFMGDEGILITDIKAVRAAVQFFDEGWQEKELKAGQWLDPDGSYRIHLPDGKEAVMSPLGGSGGHLPFEFGMGGMGGMGGGFCWVAREVYGERDPRWLLFREWLLRDAPGWLLEAYGLHGQAFARWIHDKPAVKSMVRVAMDAVIANRVATSLAR